MTEPALPVISVRGEARLMVPPDYAVVSGQLAETRDTKAAALRAAAEALDRLTTDLAGLGGAAEVAGTERHPLTWSAHTAGTNPEYYKDERGHGPTGRTVATVALLITIRDLSLLDPVGNRLAQYEQLDVHQVGWHVDWDNPAWPVVRAAAITAAIGKGRDYAAALGGSLGVLVHIADAGLLGGSSGADVVFRATSAGKSRHEGDSPDLNPMPQELGAVIEARFTALEVSLDALADGR